MPGESALLRIIIQSWKEQLIILHSLLSGPMLLLLFLQGCFALLFGRGGRDSTARLKMLGNLPIVIVWGEFLSSSTLVHCPVLCPTMSIHQAQQIVGNPCLLGIQQVSASAVCLLFQSHMFLPLNEQVMLLCVVELCVEKVGCERDWLWAGFLIWH